MPGLDLLGKIKDDGPALFWRHFSLVLQELVQSSGQQKDKGRVELADLGYSLGFLWDFLEHLHFLPARSLLGSSCAFGLHCVSGVDVKQLVLLE